MSSASISISDYARAIQQGAIPGSFSEGRLSFDFPPVVSTSSRGATKHWTISVWAETEGKRVPFPVSALEPGALADGMVGVLASRSWQATRADGEPGKVKASKPTRVTAGKNLGRANATNPLTQALRDALGRYNKHARVAGLPSAPANRQAATANQVAEEATANPPPMLVRRLAESGRAALTPEDFRRGVTVQRKLDGVRLVAHLRDGGVSVYSRTGGEYKGLGQLRNGIQLLLERAPPAGPELLKPLPSCEQKSEAALSDLGPVYLDGEAYLHGKSLEWISGQARRSDDDATLEYWVYDCFFPEAVAANVDVPSARRQEYLDRLFAAAPVPPHVRRVKNHPAADLAEVKALADQFVREGYEGAIARRDCAGYRYSHHGYHSTNLLKVKPLYSAEFKVVGYTEGKRGKDKGALVWICEVDPEHSRDAGDRTFRVVPKNMTYDERYRIYQCLAQEVERDGAPATRFERDFEGLPLTVEFPGRSKKTGKPLQAKALAFRTYEAGPENDPVKLALAACSEA